MQYLAGYITFWLRGSVAACTTLDLFFINLLKMLGASKSSFLKTLMFVITTILITGSIWQ